MPAPHQVFGPRDGPALVLVHGFPFDRRMWRLQVGPLSQAGLRVVTLDLPGFGQNETPSADIGIHARAILDLLDHLHVPKATVAGFSMGGYVALAVAALAAPRLNGLILIDSRANADDEAGRTRRDGAIADVEAHGTRGLALRQVETQFTAATRAQHRILVEEVRDLMLAQGKGAVVAGLQMMRDRPDRLQALAQLDAPVLILVGSDDKVTPIDAAQAMTAAAKDATLTVIDGAAHLSPMEQAQQVNQAIIDWMASP